MLYTLVLCFMAAGVNINQAASLEPREARFLSFLTNIKQSLLPSITRQLPKPEQFVDLRKVSPQNDVQSEELNENKERKPLLPTRIPPPYKETLGNKESIVETIVDIGQNQHQDYFNDRRPFNPDSLFRRILDRDINEGQGQYGPQNRRIADEEIEQNHNDINNDNLAFLDDQLAQESYETYDRLMPSKFETFKTDRLNPPSYDVVKNDNLLAPKFNIDDIKPLNTMLTKDDKEDAIYSQMNFWRKEFESERLSDFLTPAEGRQEPDPVNPIKVKPQKLLQVRQRLPFMEEDTTTTRKPTIQVNNEHPDWDPTDIEEIITEELMDLQRTLMAKDWKPLKDAPKILSDTPNIYQLSNNDMKDILKTVKKEDLFNQRKLRPFVDIKKRKKGVVAIDKRKGAVAVAVDNVANMTAAPDFSEMITESKVEDSLTKPDTLVKTQERFFMKSKPYKPRSSFKKPYDYKVTSEKTNVNEDQALPRSIPIPLDDSKELMERSESINKSSNEREESQMPSDNQRIESSSGQDDIIPLFLHIPKSSTCPKFCITVNVQITRTGRQIKNDCRKSFICRTYNTRK